jgi:hypothetical protein
MSDRLCLSRIKKLMLNPRLSCPHNIDQDKGNNMSRFEKLTHVLWHCQYHIVSLSGAEGADSTRGVQLCSSLQQSAWLSGDRVECSSRSCAFAGEGATEGVDIPADRHGEREKRITAIHALPVSEAKAVLEQRFLGQRLLCRYGGS